MSRNVWFWRFARITVICSRNKKYKNESNKIFNYIFFNLKRGRGLTSGTELFKKNDESRNLGIYLLHVYFIERTKINGCNEYIILRNPHTFRKLKNSENNVDLEVGWSKLLIYNWCVMKNKKEVANKLSCVTVNSSQTNLKNSTKCFCWHFYIPIV